MTLARRTPLRTRSQKLARLQRVYSKLRRDFLEEHPWCLRCGGTATEIHHAAGRLNGDLLRVENFRALCSACHRWVTEHPREAIQRGYSLPRIGGVG